MRFERDEHAVLMSGLDAHRRYVHGNAAVTVFGHHVSAKITRCAEALSMPEPARNARSEPDELLSPSADPLPHERMSMDNVQIMLVFRR